MSKILAVDLGGTRCRIGVAPADNPAAVALITDKPTPDTRAEFVETLAAHLREHATTRLGIGIPGLALGSVCTWVPNLPHLDGLDLAATFPDITIGLGNDAQLSLLAEARAGAALHLYDVVLLAIGTGIGSAVMASGTIISGHAGAACSFGWATADLSAPPHETNGWLERQASGRALDALAEQMGLTRGYQLIDAARVGHPEAKALLAQPMQALGASIASAVSLLDPAAVIVAGGVADAMDVLGPMIRVALEPRVPPHLRNVPLLPGKHASQAGLVGAALAGASGPNWRKVT